MRNEFVIFESDLMYYALLYEYEKDYLDRHIVILLRSTCLGKCTCNCTIIYLNAAWTQVS